MVTAGRPEPQGRLGVFEQTCAYCGARLRVRVTHIPDDPHREAYACPECGKGYEAQATGQPQVLLLRPRTDGKGDRYQETMF